MQKNFSTDKVLKLRAIIPVIGVIIYTLLLFFILIWPNFKGFGDNGDFARMMEWGGIDYQTNDYSLKYWHNVNRFFNLIPLKNSPKEKFVSSELLFLYPSIWINRFFYDGKYDLAVLGFLHIIAAAIALFLILSFFSKIKWQYSLIILLPVLMFFSDFGHIGFLNTFYQEPSIFISILFLIANWLFISLDEKNNHWKLILFFLALVFLLFSKVQMVLPAVVIAILTVLVWRKYYNKVVLFFCLLTILICAGFYLAKGIPKTVKKINIYHIVFYTALQEAQDKPKFLSVLNLPANAEKYAGTSAFEANTALYLPEIYPAMNLSLLAKLAKYYLNHPKEFFNLIKKTTTYINQPDWVILPNEKNLFIWWLKTKNKIFPKSPYSLLTLFVIAAGISFLNFKSNPSNKIDRGLFYLQVLTILGAITSFFSALGDGLSDIEKHLWPFNLFFDILIINLLLNFYIWFDKVKYKLKGV